MIQKEQSSDSSVPSEVVAAVTKYASTEFREKLEREEVEITIETPLSAIFPQDLRRFAHRHAVAQLAEVRGTSEPSGDEFLQTQTTVGDLKEYFLNGKE